MSKGTLQLPGYIPGIDGLRAVAVLAVMLYHLMETLLPGGFTGVDVFFVISGYVVSGSLSRDSGKPFPAYLLDFYARRIRRIFPALVVVLLVTGLLATLFIPRSWLSSSSQLTGLYAFFGLSNFALVNFNDGYFSPRVDFNPYTHTWSLAVEEQFYLTFPLIFFFWLAAQNHTGRVRRALGYVLMAATVASLIFSVYQTRSAADKAFYFLPSRFWELGAGALLFIAHAKGHLRVQKPAGKTVFLLAGTVLAMAGFVLASKSAFPFPWALLPVAATLVLIAALVDRHQSTRIQKVFEHPLAVYVGKRSYSLYLWHWPVYVLMRWTVGLENIFWQLLAVSLTFALAHWSYRWVEQPFLKGQWLKRIPNKWLLPAGIGLLAIAFWGEKTLFNHQAAISQSVVVKNAGQWFPYQWPGGIPPEQVKPKTGRHLYVLGDSHAGAYKAMLTRLEADTGLDVVLMTRGGCGVANLLSPAIKEGNPCKEIITQQLERISKEAKPGDAVFLASLRSYRYGDQWARTPEAIIKLIPKHPGWQKLRKQAFEEAVNVISQLQDMGITVIMDAPKPVFKAPNIRCSDWFNRNNPICEGGLSIDKDELLNHQKSSRLALQKLQQRFPELLVWNPMDTLCPGQTCYAWDEQGPLFMDGDHLSAHGNVVLYPAFVRFLKTHGLVDEKSKLKTISGARDSGKLE